MIFDEAYFSDDEEDVEVRYFTVIIKVSCLKGEEGISVVSLSDLDMELIEPVLLDIKSRRGYFPTGKFVQSGCPTPKDLYGHYSGWDILSTALPKPLSGFPQISEVKVYKDEPMVLDMLNDIRQ
jgi:hypothetical protein